MVEHTLTKWRQKDLKHGSMWATRNRLFYTIKASQQDPRFNSDYKKQGGKRKKKKKTPKPSLYGIKKAAICPLQTTNLQQTKGNDAL